MQIKVTAEDLIRRCVWDNYVYYIVGSEKEAEKKLKENSEFELSERDALIIGLLKVIETDNLIFKFNTSCSRIWRTIMSHINSKFHGVSSTYFQQKRFN